MPPPPSPPPTPPYTRIDLGELKSQIVKNVGPERAKRYFGYLNQFLSWKLSKPEFNKCCLLVLGHENVPLHNQLVRSILKNAVLAKSPPQSVHKNGHLRNSANVERKTSRGEDGTNGTVPATLPTVWSNGNILPSSPRKVRSSIREWKIKDCPNPLGPSGQADVTAHQALLPSNEAIWVNGTVSSHELKRPAQHHQNEPEEQPAKKPRVENRLLHGCDSMQDNDALKVAEVDVREEVEQCNTMCFKEGPLRAPLGIPFCPASTGGARRSSPLLSSPASTSCSSYSGELRNTEVLISRLERIAEAQGLGGATIDCANLLNYGLDSYLKQLIWSSVDLVRARSEKQAIKYQLHKQQDQVNQLNGVLPGSHMYVQNRLRSFDDKNQMKSPYQISLEDFRVAMELNPRQLGEEWPLLLEKICIRSFRE